MFKKIHKLQFEDATFLSVCITAVNSERINKHGKNWS